MIGKPPSHAEAQSIDDDAIWDGLSDRAQPAGWGSYQDPVLGYLPMPPLLRQALDLRAVQRLRSVKQLSGLDLVYPGATHTRFEHSVGVMWLAGVAHDVLARKARQARVDQPWPRLDVATKLAVMFAGLLHDVGHGPYSHTYEMFRERERIHAPHAEHSFITIAELDSQIKDFLHAVAARLAQRCPTTYELLYPANVADLVIPRPLAGVALEPYSFLGSIVSGIFDVDRLDYLRRDAIHTGVPVGVESNEIIAAYTLALVSRKERRALEDGVTEEPADEASGEVEGERQWVLKLEAGAADTVERMLATRDAAYRKLYYQRTHRAGQEMLVLALQRLTKRTPELREGADVDPQDLVPDTDTELLARLQGPGGAPHPDGLLKQLYLGLKNRDLYEPLPFVLRVHEWPRTIQVRLAELQTTLNHELRDEMLACVKRMGLGHTGDDPMRILVDITKTPVVKSDAYRERFLWDGDGQRLRVEAAGNSAHLVYTGFALIERLPHLRARHGKREGVDLHDEYVSQIQSVLFFVPPRFLDRVSRRLDRGAPEARGDRCEDVHREWFVPMLEAFWTVLRKAPRESPDAPPPAAWPANFDAASRRVLEWLSSGLAFPPRASRRQQPPRD